MTVRRPDISELKQGDVIFVIKPIRSLDISVPVTVINRNGKTYRSKEMGIITLRVDAVSSTNAFCSDDICNPGLNFILDKNDIYYRDYTLAENKVFISDCLNDNKPQKEDQDINEEVSESIGDLFDKLAETFEVFSKSTEFKRFQDIIQNYKG